MDEDTLLTLALITLGIVGVWLCVLTYWMWKNWNKQQTAVTGTEVVMMAEPKTEAPPAPPAPPPPPPTEPVAEEKPPAPPPAETPPPAPEEAPVEPATEEPVVELEEKVEGASESEEGEVIDLVPKD